MRKLIIIILSLFFSFFNFSCANTSAGGSNAGSQNGNYVSNSLEELTCVATDDNNYYSKWYVEINPIYGGKFSQFYDSFEFKTLNRVTIEFNKGVYAEVSLIDKEQNVIFTATPNSNGLCYLFPNYKQEVYDIQIKYYNKEYELITIYDRVLNSQYDAKKLDAVEINKEIIDLMFVVDSTVSMNREIEFLQEKIENIVRETIKNTESTVRTSILLYKDLDDNYVTMYSKFTTDIAEQVNFLSNVFAYGGGDFEEAVDIAMNEAVIQDWSGTNSTKLIIHIADAPCHDKDISSWYNAIVECAKKGIRLITVASTNVNLKTEYLFRSATILTGGTYVYITNDSQMDYGNTVNPDNSYPNEEYLETCLIRLIKSYHLLD